jgi:hypothetical protein
MRTREVNRLRDDDQRLPLSGGECRGGAVSLMSHGGGGVLGQRERRTESVKVETLFALARGIEILVEPGLVFVALPVAMAVKRGGTGVRSSCGSFICGDVDIEMKILSADDCCCFSCDRCCSKLRSWG